MKHKNGISIRDLEETENGYSKGAADSTAALETVGRRAGVWREENFGAGQLLKKQQKCSLSLISVPSEVIQQVLNG